MEGASQNNGLQWVVPFHTYLFYLSRLRNSVSLNHVSFLFSVRVGAFPCVLVVLVLVGRFGWVSEDSFLVSSGFSLFGSGVFLIMASKGVSGKTPEQLDEMREVFQAKPASDIYDFEDRFCLAKIPRQPDDYDGPDRFCASRNVRQPHYLCKHHGGAGDPSQNLEPLANMKHGMNATRENLVSDFTQADQDLYDWITEVWPEAYDVDTSEDPLAEYEFHALATEIVRAERAEGFLIEQGENNEKKVFGPNGEVEFEEVPHYLADMLQRQRKLIMKMEDNLGISRKKRMQNEQAKDATEVMKAFSEVGASLINDSDAEYDPDRFGQDSE